MPQNIEIKARLQPGQLAKIKEIALSLSNQPTAQLTQTDTFYSVKNGRLKLREVESGQAELIAYTRDDQQGPKLSSYHIHHCEHPASLHQTLSHSLGVRGVVKKTRELIFIESTRVHLDNVSGLGEFLELEVVLGKNDPQNDGEQIAKELLEKFDIDDGDLIEGAYIDLLETKDEFA